MKLSQIGKPGLGLLLIALTGVMIFNSCSTAPKYELKRAPSSDSSVRAIPKDLREAVREFRSFVASNAFNAQSCATSLDSIYNELYLTPPSHFDLDKLRHEAFNVIEELWQSRVELHKKFVRMADERAIRPECVDSVRRAFVAIRFLEEYVGEWATNPAAPDPKHLPPAWSGSFPEIVKSPDFATTELRSGDLLLSRGDAFSSAAIARTGDVEGQISHLAVVYIDENTGKKYTVEAHIEVGVVVAPIETYMRDGKVRSVIFRYRGNPKVAARAAKLMFERALKATAAGANIPYDFHFNLHDDSEIYCGEVAAIGFRTATNGKLELPRFQTKISAKNREFLEDVGMTGKELFAPMDLEVDPSFDLVGEWRDLSRAEESHRKDEVLTAMFNWMEEYHYVLDKTAWTKISSTVLWRLRKWPIFSKLLYKKFPTNMSPRTLAATFTLGHAAEALFNELGERDLEQRERTGLWLTPHQMLEELEKMRIEDFSRWERWKAWQIRVLQGAIEAEPEKPRFHEIFHPIGNG